jgi:hypothetical protein
VLLIGTILGMALLYLAPLYLLFARNPLGVAAWILMTIAYVPALRFYGRSVLWAPALPVIALFYISATIDSALAYWTGRGGYWKGRIQDER